MSREGPEFESVRSGRDLASQIAAASTGSLLLRLITQALATAAQLRNRRL
jgi:hypothetical protein